MVEYVGVEPSQQTFAKKNLLYCEMTLLEIIKQYQKHKKLRKEIFALNSLLKKTFSELKEEIKDFEDCLPRTKHDNFKAADISVSPKKRKDLEEEIELIKRKIAEMS